MDVFTFREFCVQYETPADELDYALDRTQECLVLAGSQSEAIRRFRHDNPVLVVLGAFEVGEV